MSPEKGPILIGIFHLPTINFPGDMLVFRGVVMYFFRGWYHRGGLWVKFLQKYAEKPRYFYFLGSNDTLPLIFRWLVVVTTFKQRGWGLCAAYMMMVHVVVWLMKFRGGYTNRRCLFGDYFKKVVKSKMGNLSLNQPGNDAWNGIYQWWYHMSPINFRKQSATDGTWGSNLNIAFQSLALIQGQNLQIYNPDIR